MLSYQIIAANRERKASVHGTQGYRCFESFFFIISHASAMHSVLPGQHDRLLPADLRRK